jgi:quercetin dioxygenase-like cupin family protein
MIRRNIQVMLAILGIGVFAIMNFGRLSADEIDYSQINGANPPGQPTSAHKIELLTRSPIGNGQDMLVFRTTRLPGTRAPIHFHDHGGVTCVIEGETTIRVEGRSPERHVKGECFSMPPGAHMANFNSGSELMVTHDIFLLKTGEPSAHAWRVVEPGFKPAEFGQAD